MAFLVERGEAHAVRMSGENLVFPEYEIFRGEGNDVTLEENELSAAMDFREARGDSVGVHFVGLATHESEKDASVGAVSEAGQCERAEQFYLDAADASQ